VDVIEGSSLWNGFLDGVGIGKHIWNIDIAVRQKAHQFPYCA
jgi:hypothetical protein